MNVKSSFGTRRFVYNWGLAEWKRQYEAGEKPSALKPKEQVNAIRRKHCGHVKAEPSLAERIFVCDHCGSTLDRDHNAAINILNEALKLSASSM